MTCPENEILLAHASGESTGVAASELTRHLEDCVGCRSRMAALETDLEQIRESVAQFSGSALASLEARLRWQLQKGGATTLRDDAKRASGLFAWLASHRGWLAAGTAAAAVVVALLVTGPAPSVDAAAVLKRSQSALFQMLAFGDAQRIIYRVSWEGPDFGVLPEGVERYSLEELWDRAGRVKVALSTEAGELVRGFVQVDGSRRVVVVTPDGDLDMRFDVETDGLGLEQMATRRRQVASSFFKVLLRAADPERLSHREEAGVHVVELGPPSELSPILPDMFELHGARLVIDQATYRLGSAAVHGRLLGEPFRLAVSVDSVDAFDAGELDAGKFALPSLPDAVVIEGVGTRFPMADVVRALMQAATASQLDPDA